MYNAIYSYVAPYPTDWQHGFVRGLLCATQLVFSHRQRSKALDESKQVEVVFLNFAKAFDRVANNILRQKIV